MIHIGRLTRWGWALAAVVALVALGGAAVAPVDAAVGGFINFVPGTSWAGPACSPQIINYQGGYMPQFDEDGFNQDWAQLVVVDATGQLIDSVGVYGPLGGPYGFSYCIGSLCTVPPISARPLTIALFDLPGPPSPTVNYLTAGVFMDEDYFDPGTLHPACGSSPLLAPYSFLPSPPPPLFHYADGRLDDTNTVSPVAVYPTATGIQVWDANGHLLIDVPMEVLAGLPGFPDENLLIAQSADGTAALYLLTTGEYQVNAGPGADGYVYVLIWTGIPPENVYTRSFYVE